jgi:UDP-N-acetylmuramyl tripeptide synthase
MLALDPAALPIVAAGRRIGLVSGTNGKTTTTRLLAAALETRGPVTTNSAGANLLSGLVSVLAEAVPGGDAALEVDEGLLPRAIDVLSPRAVALLNLSRDQLDRIGEVRRHAASWRRSLEGSPGTAVVANADDPLVAFAASASRRVTWVATGQRWRADAASCPRCGGRVEWDAEGRWQCSSCAFARPSPDVWLDGEGAVMYGGQRLPLDLALPGRFNHANAAMALAAAAALDVDPAEAARALRSVSTVAGRYSTVEVSGTEVRLLLAKNPAGWAETLDLIRPAPLPAVVGINARIADGRDPSWLWDVPFERLAGRLVIATGDRGRDLAVRLRYAGVDHEFVPGYAAAVRAAGGPEVDLAANYTAFQDARRELARG